MTDKNEKPPTIRAKVDNIERMIVDLIDLAEEAAKPSPVKAEAPRPVAEAVALEHCIRALDALTESERNRHAAGFNPGVWLSSGAVDRILRHLASKYGVQLIEVRTEPCSHAHLDALDDTAIGYAIRQAVQP